MADPRNPLDNAMNAASLAMAAENMKDAMPGMIRYMHMIGELNAAHFKSLMGNGVPEDKAALIVSCQPPFSGFGMSSGGYKEED